MKARFAGFPLSAFSLAAACVLFASTAHALDPDRQVKDYRVTEWGMAHGLPYPSIAALAQSSDGYVWIATRTGLGRFDGATFTTFTSGNLPQLGNDQIISLCATRDGTLWVGTGRGIAWYRDGVWSRPTIGAGVDELEIAAIAERADGSVLIAHAVDMATGRARTSTLFLYANGTCRELLTSEGKDYPRIDRITSLPNGETVLAGVGLFRGIGAAFENRTRVTGITNARLHGLAADADGNVWIGSRLGLLRWSADSVRSFSSADGLPSNSVRSLLFDSDRNLWVGTSNGLARYANNQFEPLLVNGFETLSNVLCLLEDRERNLWIGTDNGLFRLQDVKVTNLGLRDGLPVNPTLCALETSDGSKWIGTIGGGLVRVTPSGVRVYDSKDGMREESVGALAEAPDGALWVAYYTRGLGRLANGHFTYFSPGDSVRFRGLAVDRQGTVWAASSDGLFAYKGEQFERVPIDPALRFPRALHLSPDGTLWIAGGRAFGWLREGKWSIHMKPPELEAQAYQNFFSDPHGATWLLQDGPFVIRVREGRVDQFTFPGLGPLVYSGFEHGGEIWINFRAGVARVPLSEFDAVAAGRKIRPNYTLYNDTDGMRSRAPNNAGSPGSFAMRDGALWFPTSMGVAVIKPDHIRLNRLPPNVVIERVLVDKKQFHGAELLDIPPSRGELAIHFTALSFVNASQVRFRHRLRGFDPDWIDAGANRVAHYGGLRPGTYDFDVIACNDEGVWNEKGATVKLVLMPHFYQQWWFFGLLGVAAAGLGASAYGWRSRRLKRHAAELEAQNTELERRIAERTAEVQRSYDALRSSEYFYHSLVESLPQVIARKDAGGMYTYANAAAAELFGRPLDQIIGHTDDELFPADVARKAKDDDRHTVELKQPIEYEEIVEREGMPKRYLHVKRVPLFDDHGHPLGVQLLFWDMTTFRETEAKLRHAQRELVEISRLAGMAEMATGVLHNLGNAVNSVKVAAAVARDKVRRCDVARIRRVAELLNAEKHRLPDFFAQDPRGAKLPQFLNLLADQLENEHADVSRELQQLGAGIEHVAQIIAAQQDGARVGGVVENIPPKELVEYACRMNQALLDRHGVNVVREYTPVPEITVDRQKVLQILGNLVRNSIEALAESGRNDRRLVIGLRPARGSSDIEIAVTDNGTGIAPPNLARIFEFGFTTKRTGHGFGLHNSAIAAQEIGGALLVHSDGVGRGATFTLRLPLVATAKGQPPVATGVAVVSS